MKQTASQLTADSSQHEPRIRVGTLRGAERGNCRLSALGCRLPERAGA